MNKTLILLLAISFLTACGGSSSTPSNNITPNTANTVGEWDDAQSTWDNVVFGN